MTGHAQMSGTRRGAAGAVPGPVFSEDRVRRLRTVLWVVVGFAVVLVLLDVATVASVGLDEDGAGAFAALLAGVAAVLLAAGGLALRLLPRRDRVAKRAAVGTGVAVLALALPMAVTWAGFVMVPIGLVVLFLALLADPEADPHADPDAGPARRRG